MACGLGLWWRTLRFHWGPEVQDLIDRPPPPMVVILWHNRLFTAPAFFRRHFRGRRLAALVSASRDGAWWAGFLRRLGVRPVRGSRHRRGPQGFRELLAVHREGCDLVFTPDGSRGPCYEMKPGAVAAARRTGAALALVSFNFSRAWRLNTWDGLYLPMPGSRVEVRIKVVVGTQKAGEDDASTATRIKAEMDAITLDCGDLPPRGRATR